MTNLLATLTIPTPLEYTRNGKAKPSVLRACETCHKDFEAASYDVSRGKAKFCSLLCSAESQHKSGGWQRKKTGEARPMHTCETCGKEFYRTPSRGVARFCSQPCRGAGISGKSNVRWKAKIPFLCQYCQTPFEINEARSTSGGGKYCSRACLKKDRAENNRAQLVCASCAKPFERQLSSISETTKENFCSSKCYGNWKSSHAENTYSRAVGGKRADLNNRYFRSRWEANWARYLNYLVKTNAIASWEYEIDTFEFTGIKRGVRFYTPDFKVHALDGSIVYHEIKGWMDAKSKTKLARMKKYHPAVRIEIYAQKEYTAMAKQYKTVLPGWESDKHDGNLKAERE